MPSLKDVHLWMGNDPAFRIEGKTIFCQLCGKPVNADRKFQFEQHKKTRGHQGKVLVARKNLPKMQQTISSAFTKQTSEPDSNPNFKEGLCTFLLKCNIPMHKVDNQHFRSFFSIHFDRQLPSSSSLRKSYMSSAYDKVIYSIQNEIGESPVWVSADETTDACGRYIVHVIVGRLTADRPGRGHLIMCRELEKVQHSTIARSINDALGILWPNGNHPDKVLAFVTDAATYMVKAAQGLQIFYPKMVHITCLAHGLHRVAETLRELMPEVNKLISPAKKVFVKAPSRVHAFKSSYPDTPLPPEPILTRWGTWIEACIYYEEHHDKVKKVVSEFDRTYALAIQKTIEALEDQCVTHHLAFIKAHFRAIPALITRLETQGLDLCTAMGAVLTMQQESANWPGDTGEALRKKLDSVLQRNPGWPFLLEISNILRWVHSDLSCDLTPGELSAMKFLPIVSCDVERSVSALKLLLSSNRRRLTVDNLEKSIVVQCYNRDSE